MFNFNETYNRLLTDDDFAKLTYEMIEYKMTGGKKHQEIKWALMPGLLLGSTFTLSLLSIITAYTSYKFINNLPLAFPSFISMGCFLGFQIYGYYKLCFCYKVKSTIADYKECYQLVSSVNQDALQEAYKKFKKK